MKKSTMAPFYVGIYPILAEVARDHGYALAVHGTVARDFDLVAIPWTDEAVSADELMLALIERADYIRDPLILVDKLFEEPLMAQKPHGRVAWSIPLEGGSACLDISVLPRAVPETDVEELVVQQPKSNTVTIVKDNSEHEKVLWDHAEKGPVRQQFALALNPSYVHNNLYDPRFSPHHDFSAGSCIPGSKMVRVYCDECSGPMRIFPRGIDGVAEGGELVNFTCADCRTGVLPAVHTGLTPRQRSKLGKTDS